MNLRIRGKKWHVRYELNKKEYTYALGPISGLTERDAITLAQQLKEDHRIKITLSGPLDGHKPVRMLVPTDSPLPIQSLASLDRGRARRGIASEYLVIADLLLKGFEVFKPVNPLCEHDLIAIGVNGSLRIEVKTADKAGSAQVRMERKSGHFDVIALVSQDNRIEYQLFAAARHLSESGKTFRARMSPIDNRWGPQPDQEESREKVQ